MSRTTVVQVSCDLCGRGGPFTRPEDFRSFGDVDLCSWCADDRPRAGGGLESGRHRVTFTEDSWSCSCGEVYRRPFVAPRIAAAVPSLVNATANLHAETP